MTYYKISHALSWLAVLTATALLCHSCNSNPQSRHKTELDHIDSLILQAPDSALALLNGMSEGTKGWQNGDRMHYDLLTIKATDKARIPLGGDSAINRIVAYYETHPDNYLLANAYYYAGRTKVQENDALLALVNFNKAQNLIHEDSVIPLNVAIQLQKGYIYRNQGFFLKEREVHRNAYRYSLHSKDTINMIFSIRDIGGTFESLENYDSCNWYLHAALKLAEMSRNEKMISNIKTSLTDNYKYLNRYDSAKYFLQHILKDVSPSSQSPAFTNATEIYEHFNQDDSARYYAEKVLKIGNVYGKRDVCLSLTRIDLRRKDVKGARRNFERYVEYVDSANRLKSEEALANAMSLYDYSEYVTQSQKAQSDRDIALMWMAIAILAFLVAVGCAVYLYVLLKKKRKKERMRKILLDSLSLKDSGSEAKVPLVPDMKVRLQELLDREKVIKQKDWLDLLDYMDINYPGFMMKLNSLAKFNISEKTIFILRKLDFSNKEIAQLLSKTPQSVSTTRTRAYKKVTGKDGRPEDMDKILELL